MHEKAETSKHLTDYLKVLWRRKWIMITFFMTIVPFVVVGTFIQKSIYRATASLIIEMEARDMLEFNDETTLGVEHYHIYNRYLNTQIEVVKSKHIASKVFDELNLKEIFEKRVENLKHLVPVENFFQMVMNPQILAENARKQIQRFISKNNDNLPEPIDIENLKDYEDYYDSADTYLEEFIDKINVEVVRESQIMNIRVEDENQRLAAIMANKIADIYIEQNRDYRLKAFSEGQDWLTKEIEKQKEKLRISELRLQDYRELNNITSYDVTEDSDNNISRQSIQEHMKSKLAELKLKLAEAENLYRGKNPKMIRLMSQVSEAEISLNKERTADLEYQKKGIKYTSLKREVEVNKSIYQVMLNRLSEISISGEFNANNVRFKDRSVVPSRPIRPKKALNILVSIVFGLVGGTGLALLFNYFDRRIKDSDTVVKDLELNLLGEIGVITNSKCSGIQRERDKAWHATRYPISPITEQFRNICTIIYFSLQDKDKKSIPLTSYGTGDGKTLISINVAQTLSFGGSKTLLVDADFRRPKIHTFFDCDNNTGLSTFLQDKTDLNNIIQKTNLSNLYIVTSGINGTANGGNPFELFNSQRMWDFVRETEKTFDRIIYDLPPFGIVNDAFMLSSITKAVVLVIEYNKINRENILYAKQLFEKLNIKITGAILNKCQISKDSYYYKYHGIQDEVLRNVSNTKLIALKSQQ